MSTKQASPTAHYAVAIGWMDSVPVDKTSMTPCDIGRVYIAEVMRPRNDHPSMLGLVMTQAAHKITKQDNLRLHHRRTLVSEVGGQTTNISNMVTRARANSARRGAYLVAIGWHDPEDATRSAPNYMRLVQAYTAVIYLEYSKRPVRYALALSEAALKLSKRLNPITRYDSLHLIDPRYQEVRKMTGSLPDPPRRNTIRSSRITSGITQTDAQSSGNSSSSSTRQAATTVSPRYVLRSRPGRMLQPH